MNTFCNVRTKVLTLSQLQTLTQGFGRDPKNRRFCGGAPLPRRGVWGEGNGELPSRSRREKRLPEKAASF